jgi:hypothetical protein
VARRSDASAARGKEANPESRRAWLRSDNPYLGGLTPLEVLRAGRTDRVEAALEALDSGMFV